MALRCWARAVPVRKASASASAPLRRCWREPLREPRATRCNSTHCMSGVEPPWYAKIPIVPEDADAVLAEMPELALGGQGSSAAAAVAGADARRYADIPLDKVFEQDQQVPSETTATASSAAPATQFAELSNGVRVAVVDRGGHCASVGLFVQLGSRYEEPEVSCMPHFLELMAFRSSGHLSHIRMLKTLEQLGAATSCRVGREDLLYQIDVLREYVPVVLPLMLANVLCPSVLPEEVESACEHVLEVQKNLEENPENLVTELLHLTAYEGNTLGNKLYADEKDLTQFSAENLRKFIQKECTPDRLILVGVNVEFEELCKWTARSFAEHPLGEASPTGSPEKQRPMTPAVYTGGERRLERVNPLCHLMLGWEVKGGWNGQFLASVTVLQMFLGGGGSFSTGGPGKGMHTRLYTDVLNRHHWVESCNGSSVMYADSGLFTIYATVVPKHAGDFISVLARIFKSVSQISEEELVRAKNALKSSIHMNLEMRAVMMEDIGRQLVLSGKVGTAQEFGRMIDAVNAKDLADVLRECLKTRLTLVAYGAIEKVPAYEEIAKTLAVSIP
eukprot:CAMPEP_0170630580 /NCGR_PEP_ID=MMETSP0224-20130122/34090_1 /TAXON_ID=285029 /ORGANISM="Togula jolla, Strain CCCM 725" /LENGTH=561 /DNA_ID=CAMNT_0010958675 /DNA_START=8 /DNA_END=1693 /DNA_ORIENTATION=-